MATFYEVSPEQAAILMDGKHTLQTFFNLIECVLVRTFNKVDEPNHGLLYEEIAVIDDKFEHVFAKRDTLMMFWQLLDAMEAE